MIRRKSKKNFPPGHKSTFLFVENSSYETPYRKKENGILSKIFTSEALLVAIFPILVYLLVYVTYTSFLGSFGIPIHFIDFNFSIIINNIVTAFIVLVSFNIIIFGIIGNVPPRMRNQIPIRLLLIFVYFSALWFLSLIIFGTTQHAFLVWSIFVLFFIFPVIIGPIIVVIVSTIAKNKEPKRKLIKNYFIESFNKLDKNTGIWIEILGGTRNAVFILIYLGLLFAGFAHGKISARTQEYFLVAKLTPECVVLYNSSERVICSPFNRIEKEVDPAYKVLYYQDKQEIEFRQENVGPLHMKPTYTPTPKPTFTPTITRTSTQTRIPTMSSTIYP